MYIVLQEQASSCYFFFKMQKKGEIDLEYFVVDFAHRSQKAFVEVSRCDINMSTFAPRNNFYLGFCDLWTRSNTKMQCQYIDGWISELNSPLRRSRLQNLQMTRA